MTKPDYTGLTVFNKVMEDINASATGKKAEESTNSKTLDMIIKYRRWYRQQNPKAKEREITRAVNRKFWGS